MKDLKITREFGVTPELAFDAFTKPEAMRVWWTDTTIFDIDLRVGGRWTITRKEGGTEYIATGEYLEVERPKRLKYSWGMPQFSPDIATIAIDITPDGEGGCQVVFIHSGPGITAELEALPEGSVSGSEKGWQMGFDLMEAAWEKH